MLQTILQRSLWVVVLVAAQMIVFNHIHLWGYATPFPFVYLLLLFPMGTQRWTAMLWGFVCGLMVDIVSLTPGVASGAMTLAAFIQPPLLQLMAPKDALEDMQASPKAMGLWVYVRYAAMVTAVFTLAYFLLAVFNFFHIRDVAIACVTSWLLTLVLCLLFEAVRSK